MCTEAAARGSWPVVCDSTEASTTWRADFRVGVVLVFLAGLYALSACSRVPPELGIADYASLHLRKSCSPGDRLGSAGGVDRISIGHDISVSVRTPINYDGTMAHPLLVVFAPGGYHRIASEDFYGLTREATTAGFIVAYPDHRKLSLQAFEQLGQVPALVAGKWCVDSGRVYFAGHSDGGTTSAALTFLDTSELRPRAVAISAAGIRRQDLEQYACPQPLSVLIVHSRRDELLAPPEYGKDAAQWWAACNKCRTGPGAMGEDGCVEYGGCAHAVRTRYCEVETAHRHWSVPNTGLLAFFATTTGPAGVGSSPGSAPAR